MSNDPTGSVVYMPRFSVELAREAGWCPPAQTITEPTGLDALPEQTAIVIGGYAFQRFGGWWHGSGGVMPMHSEQVIEMHEGEVATVVWSPTEKAATE